MDQNAILLVAGELPLGFRVQGLGRSSPIRCKAKRVFPKIRGTSLGVPMMRTVVFWGLYRGPLILGNYRIAWSFLPRHRGLQAQNSSWYSLAFFSSHVRCRGVRSGCGLLFKRAPQGGYSEVHHARGRHVFNP